MVNIALQLVCSFLFAVGLLFILIDLRTRFDRSFRFFGVSLILLCAMTAIDIWIIPTKTEIDQILLWQCIYHALACIFIPFSLWYLCILTQSSFLKSIPFLILVSSLLAACFVAKVMIVAQVGKVQTTIGYNFFFLPYVAFYIFTAHFVILKRINKCAAPEQRILRFHLVGFAILLLCGLLDIGIMLGLMDQVITSFTVVGVLVFGIMGSLIFAERFVMILQDRQLSFDKLESAYKELEQVNALKQIGESTAMINHEIKNYMFMIAGNAQILQEIETLSERGKEKVKNIVTSVERLTDFSDDILKLSRTEIIREKHPVNLPDILKGTIEKHFLSKKESFILKGLEQDGFIYGDWGKLEQVFVNIFNNSFEAAKDQNVEIKIRLTNTDTSAILSIEDNGTGCNEEQLTSLFKAFYTTKKNQGGTGLGMSITRTLIECHGGKISAYSKNLGMKGESGLKLVITFPVFAQNMAEAANKKHPIVLVKEGMENLQGIIRVFQNLRVTPYIVQNAAELKELDFDRDAITVIVSAKTMSSQYIKLNQYPWLSLVSNHDHNVYILDHGRGNRPEVFSEEYVVTRMLRKQVQRTRLRERHHNLAA